MVCRDSPAVSFLLQIGVDMYFGSYYTGAATAAAAAADGGACRRSAGPGRSSGNGGGCFHQRCRAVIPAFCASCLSCDVNVVMLTALGFGLL